MTAPAGVGGSILKSPAVDSIPELASSDDELDTTSSEEDNGLSDSPAESTDICVSPPRAGVPVSENTGVLSITRKVPHLSFGFEAVKQRKYVCFVDKVLEYMNK